MWGGRGGCDYRRGQGKHAGHEDGEESIGQITWEGKGKERNVKMCQVDTEEESRAPQGM